MSIKNKIGGLVAGWIFSLVVAIVTGIVKRALAKQQQRGAAQTSSQQPHTKVYGEQPRPAAKVEPLTVQPYKKWAIKDTIYQGMTRDELVKAYGEPAARMKTSDTREVWTYGATTTANDNAMTVTIESGLVTDWTEAAATIL